MKFYKDLNESGTYEEFMKTVTIEKTFTIPKFEFDLLSLLADGFSVLEGHDWVLSEVIMNARTYSHFRKLGRDILDIVTDAETLKSGHFASIWGAKILLTKKIPDNAILLFSEKRNQRKTVLLQENTETSSNTQELLNLSHRLNGALQSAQNIRRDIDKVIYDLTKKEE